MTERTGISVDLALEKLHKAGIEMKRQGLTRYLRTGEILGQPPRPDYPKEGWVVDVDSLQEFIDLKTMSVNELRLLVKKLQEENLQLKAAAKGRAKKEEVDPVEDVAPGQLSLEDVETETFEFGRSDINKLQLTAKEKKEMRELLFKDVPKNQKLKVEVPAGTTIEDFIKDKIKKPE